MGSISEDTSSAAARYAGSSDLSPSIVALSKKGETFSKLISAIVSLNLEGEKNEQL